MPALTKRRIDAAKPGAAESFLWCSSTPGFGLRLYPSGKRVFICQVRVGRATRRVKIGPYGAYTVEQARERAQEISRLAAQGRDPQREKTDLRNALLVKELCEQYMAAARKGLVMTRFKRSKRGSTLDIDAGRISRHIVPLVGNIRALDLTPSDVQGMVDDITTGKTAGEFKGQKRGVAKVSGGAGAATRAVGLLGGIYTWARKRKLVPLSVNPTQGVETAAAGTKERILMGPELARLGKVLDAKADKWPKATAALRLIALTGFRREEACGLRWEEIDRDGHCVRLANTKTGRSMRPLGQAALDYLESLKSEGAWVFPNAAGDGSADLKKTIALIFNEAGIHDARSQELRRTFGSIASDEGYSDSTVAELIGHSRRGVTHRNYIRRPDAALIAAADRVSQRIANALASPTETDNVVTIDRRLA